MKYSILLFVAVSFLFSCNHPDAAKHHEMMKARLDSLKNELLKTDITFSQMSEEKGRNAAFMAYAAEDATVLRPFSMPVVSKDSLAELFKVHPDSMYTLTWLPIRCDMARSGDIGYTYGTYTLKVKNMSDENGTYCTVWKREKGQGWKFIVDTGNEGLKPADKSTDVAINAEIRKDQKKDLKAKH